MWRSRARSLWVALFLIAAVASGAGAEPSISFGTRPGAEFAVGSATDLFGMGLVTGLRLEYGFLRGPLLFAGLDAEYTRRRVESLSDASLTTTAASALVGSYLAFSPRLRLRAEGIAGYHSDSYVHGADSLQNSDPVLGAGLGLSFVMTPAIDVGLEGRFTTYLNGLSTATAAVSASLYLRGREYRQRLIDEARASGRSGSDFLVPEIGEGIEFSDLELKPVFPVLFARYETDGIGSLTLRNLGERAAEGIEVSVFVRQYMDAPQAVDAPVSLAPGEDGEVRLSVLLNERLLEVTEGSRVAAELSVQYRTAGLWYRRTVTETLRLHDRNAITWEDDRRAAAFVTSKDPVVLEVAKASAGTVRSYLAPAVDMNLRIALALHDTLDLLGVEYVVDPSTPYAELSSSEQSVDFLQFPRQTLRYAAGDCDDLAILYCALLESVGVQSAFITVPGHIYTAFRVSASPEELSRLYQKPDNFVVIDDTAWIPVEVTLRGQGFLRAWAEGARQWREASAAGTAGFFRVADAWAEYEPVGFSLESADVVPPDPDSVRSAFEAEVGRFVDQEIYSETETLRTRISRNARDLRSRNRLATLYARYGKLDEARVEFESILRVDEYLPALVNLGNLAFMQERFMEALQYYDRAELLDDTALPVLVGLARTHHRLENYGFADHYFERVAAADSTLAEQFRYVASRDDGASRASDARSLTEVQLWMKEE